MINEIIYGFNNNGAILRYNDLKALYIILNIPENPLINAQTLGPSQ